MPADESKAASQPKAQRMPSIADPGLFLRSGKHSCRELGESEASTIPQEWMCDGLPDCEDGSDEKLYGCNSAVTCKSFYSSEEFSDFFGGYMYYSGCS